MRHRIGKKGLALVKSFEGFVPYVYDDLIPPVHGRYREWKRGTVVKGTLTIGYGHTDAAKYDLRFKLKDVPEGFRLSEREALRILDVDLDECEEAVSTLVTAKLTQGQFDALTSFAFNCGVGNLRKLIVPLNRGDYDGCRRKFDEFIRSKGKVLNGLVRRRDAEQALWDDRYDDVALPESPVHHVAEVDTPQPKPLMQSTIANGATVGGGFTIAGLAATVWDKFAEAPASLQDAAVKAAAKPALWFIFFAGLACAYVWWRRKRMQEA